MHVTRTFHQTCMATLGICLFALFPTVAVSQFGEGIKIGVFGGASAPQSGIGNVYDVLASQGVKSSYNAARTLGGHFGLKARVGITQSLSAQATASFNQFSDLQQDVSVFGVPVPTFLSSSSYIPVTAGISWLPIRSVVVVGLSGELAYSYKTVGLTADQRSKLESLNLDIGRFEYQRSGVGAALGAMVGVNILGIEPYAEVKHIWTNAFLKDQDDPVSSFLQMSVGLMF